MTREEEFEKVKGLIKEKIEKEDITLGLYFTRNIIGDSMTTVFSGDFFDVDVCFWYQYFEVFGCTPSEEKSLVEFYSKFGGL